MRRTDTSRSSFEIPKATGRRPKRLHALWSGKVDLVVAINTNVAFATKQATTEVPIVFAAGADPVRAGLVDSISAPGGRLTGFHFLSSDLTAKRLEILHEIAPKLRRIVSFYDPRNPAAVDALTAAQGRGPKAWD